MHAWVPKLNFPSYEQITFYPYLLRLKPENKDVLRTPFGTHLMTKDNPKEILWILRQFISDEHPVK